MSNIVKTRHFIAFYSSMNIAAEDKSRVSSTCLTKDMSSDGDPNDMSDHRGVGPINALLPR